MPKIIENARGLLIGEAKRQIEEKGYDAVTIRSIARGCGLGLGTFYNYFKSKDVLIASFLLEDWKERIDRVEVFAKEDAEPLEVIRMTCEELSQFIESNLSIFSSPVAIKSFNSTAATYHKVLRLQLAKPIKYACESKNIENAEFLSQFVAEAILSWTVAKKTYADLEPLLIKLLA